MQKILHVSDNPEHFSSIGSALAQIPANNTTPVIIEIAPGIYHEKLTINKPYITLRGMLTPSSAMMIMPWI
jgi:pectinesterase